MKRSTQQTFEKIVDKVFENKKTSLETYYYYAGTLDMLCDSRYNINERVYALSVCAFILDYSNPASSKFLKEKVLGEKPRLQWELLCVELILASTEDPDQGLVITNFQTRSISTLINRVQDWVYNILWAVNQHYYEAAWMLLCEKYDVDGLIEILTNDFVSPIHIGLVSLDKME